MTFSEDLPAAQGYGLIPTLPGAETLGQASCQLGFHGKLWDDAMLLMGPCLPVERLSRRTRQAAESAINITAYCRIFRRTAVDAHIAADVQRLRRHVGDIECSSPSEKNPPQPCGSPSWSATDDGRGKICVSGTSPGAEATRAKSSLAVGSRECGRCASPQGARTAPSTP